MPDDAVDQRLRLLLNRVDVIIADWALPSKKVTFVSQRAEAILGYPLEAWYSTPNFWETTLLHPDDRDAAVDFCAKQTKEGLDHDFVYRVRHADGHIMWVHEFVSVVTDEAGRVSNLTCVLIDVTKQRHMENALRKNHEHLKKAVAVETQLRKSEERFQAFTRATSNVIYRMSPDWTEMWSLQGREFISDTLEPSRTWLERYIHPDDQSFVMTAIQQAIRTKSVFELEHRVVRVDGTLGWTSSRAIPILDDEGEVLEWFGAAADITPRKAAEAALRKREENLRAILNTAADAIINIDHEGTINDTNPATERMFGYTTSELVGMNLSTLIPTAADCLAYLKNKAGMTGECVGHHKETGVFPVSVSVSQIDHLDIYTVIIRDISEQKCLQNQLLNIVSKEQRRIGQELHDVVGQELLALGIVAETLSHVIREMPVDAHASEASRLVRKISTGLDESLKMVRSLSRGLIPVEIDPHGLVSSIEDLVDRIRVETRLNCSFDCTEAVSLENSDSATHLFRIAQEAVSNAIKHAHAKSLCISFHNDDHALELRVCDDGIGINHNSNRHSGVGIKIMHYRAGLIGARLNIFSNEPRGTCVRCVIEQPVRQI